MPGTLTLTWTTRTTTKLVTTQKLLRKLIKVDQDTKKYTEEVPYISKF